MKPRRNWYGARWLLVYGAGVILAAVLLAACLIEVNGY